MSVITFDTWKFVKSLEAGGFTQAQAEAQVRAMLEATASISDELVTKTDLREMRSDITAEMAGLRTEMADVRSELKVIRWMIGIMFAGIVSLVLKAFFHG